MTTRTIVLPELRMPFEDRTAWTTVLNFIADYRPDQIIQLGHLLNLPPCGRFTGQATLELRRRELTHAADYVRQHYLARLRNVHDGPLRIVYSSASARLAAALQSTAGPNSGATSTCVERLVHLDTWDGIDLVGVCVIVGHTLRLGKASYTVNGTDGATHAVTGVETGSLVDQQPTRSNNGHTRSGQPGLVIVETHGARVAVDCLALTANHAAVRWAGQPQTTEATAPQPQPIAAHAVEEPAGVAAGQHAARAV